MKPRLSRVAVLALLVGCDSDDAVGPQDFTGTWLPAGRHGSFGREGPDTLVLDVRGGGRVAFQVQTSNPDGTWATGWASSPVRYRLSGRDVLLRWCAETSTAVAGCADEWGWRGRFGRDGLLWIGPTSPASSMSAQPWRRAPAHAFAIRQAIVT